MLKFLGAVNSAVSFQYSELMRLVVLSETYTRMPLRRIFGKDSPVPLLAGKFEKQIAYFQVIRLHWVFENLRHQTAQGQIPVFHNEPTKEPLRIAV